MSENDKDLKTTETYLQRSMELQNKAERFVQMGEAYCRKSSFILKVSLFLFALAGYCAVYGLYKVRGLK